MISEETVAVLERSDVAESLIVWVVDKVKSLESECVRETSEVIESDWESVWVSDIVLSSVCVVDNVWSLVNVFVAERSEVPDSVKVRDCDSVMV